jgi:nanoRNase/pAp phosphatase (c-di-AMP/oligoRNAs hydrolase)
LTKTKSVYAPLAAAVEAAGTILILQPDSPDGDSLGSALGLEEIFGDLGKKVVMYSYKEPETYLHGLEGWDRVSQDLPKSFDLTILVDTGSPSLIKSAQRLTRPHHLRHYCHECGDVGRAHPPGR